MKENLTDLEYHPYDPETRLYFFDEAYRTVASLDIPAPPLPEDDIESEVPDDEYWLECAAYHAQIALLDALAGLTDITSNKVEEAENGTIDDDTEGIVYDDEA